MADASWRNRRDSWRDRRPTPARQADDHAIDDLLDRLETQRLPRRYDDLDRGRSWREERPQGYERGLRDERGHREAERRTDRLIREEEARRREDIARFARENDVWRRRRGAEFEDERGYSDEAFDRPARPARRSEDGSLAETLARLDQARRRWDDLAREPVDRAPLREALADIIRRQQMLTGEEDLEPEPRERSTSYAERRAARWNDFDDLLQPRKEEPRREAAAARDFDSASLTAALAPALRSVLEDLLPNLTSAQAAPLVADVRALGDRLNVIAREVGSANERSSHPPEMISRLARDVEQLSDKLDMLSTRVHAFADEQDRREPYALTRIEQELAALRHDIRSVADNTRLDGLEDRIAALAERLIAINDSAERGVNEALVPVIDHMERIQRSVDDIGAMASARFDEVARLDDSLNSLLVPVVDRLERAGQAIEGLGVTTAERIAAMSSRQFTTVELALRDLASRIDRLSSAATPAAEGAFESVRRTLTEIRDQLGAASIEGGAELDQAREAMERLSQRIEDLGQIRPDLVVDTIRREVESIGQRLAANIRIELQQPVSAIEKAVHELGRRVERMESLGGPDVSGAVEKAVELIAARIDRVMGPNVQLETIEHGLAEVLRQLERQPGPANDRDAQAALRQAMAEFGGAGLDRLVREIGELRQATEGTERRTAEVLDAVRHALQRVSERMPEPARAPGAAAPAARPEAEPISAAERARAAAQRASQEFAQAEKADARVRTEPPRQPMATPIDGAEGVSSRARLIAQARRSLAEESAAASRSREPLAGDAEPKEERGGRFGRVLGGLTSSTRRRQAVVGLAAGLVLMGSWQAARTVMDGGDVQQSAAMAALEAKAPAAAPQKPAAKPAEPKREMAAAPRVLPDVPDPETTGGLPPAGKSGSGVIAAPDLPLSSSPPSASNFAPIPGPKLVKPDPSSAEILALAPAPVAPPAGAPLGHGFSAPTPVGPATVQPARDLPAQIGSGKLRGKAQAGDMLAMYEVGLRFLEGRNVERDPARGLDWLERAANQGMPLAQYQVGSLYEKGIGTTKNAQTAKAWYEKAAAGGNVRAMHNLGVLFAEGGLGTVDLTTAATWFRKAAERGIKDSQYNLAVLYARGLGVKQNLSEAYLWFSLAAQQGDKDAGQKREQVAEKLDKQALMAAKLATSSFKLVGSESAANEAPASAWDDPPATAKNEKPKR